MPTIGTPKTQNDQMKLDLTGDINGTKPSGRQASNGYGPILAGPALRFTLRRRPVAGPGMQPAVNQRSSTNLYLRRIHNFALGMDWLLKPIIPRLEWPKVVYGEKRAITLDEHRRIIAHEPNEERRNIYEMLWHLGGSQSDVANLHAGDIDWEVRTIGYDRCKTRNRPRRAIKPPIIHFGPMTFDFSVSESAGSDSLHRLVRYVLLPNSARNQIGSRRMSRMA